MSTFLIDFDGTIVEHKFPEIGQPLPYAFEVLRTLKAAGNKLILWTCREDSPRRKYLTEAVEFCLANGVVFDAVNEALPNDFREDGLKRKPHAHYHIDDHNFPRTDIDWELIGIQLGVYNA